MCSEFRHPPKLIPRSGFQLNEFVTIIFHGKIYLYQRDYALAFRIARDSVLSFLFGVLVCWPETMFLFLLIDFAGFLAARLFYLFSVYCLFAVLLVFLSPACFLCFLFMVCLLFCLFLAERLFSVHRLFAVLLFCCFLFFLSDMIFVLCITCSACVK